MQNIKNQICGCISNRSYQDQHFPPTISFDCRLPLRDGARLARIIWAPDHVMYCIDMQHDVVAQNKEMEPGKNEAITNKSGAALSKQSTRDFIPGASRFVFNPCVWPRKHSIQRQATWFTALSYPHILL